MRSPYCYPCFLVSSFFYYLLVESGIINTLKLSCSFLLRPLGINSSSVDVLALSAVCKLPAIYKTRTLAPSKEKLAAILLSLFLIPCISQLTILINLLSIVQQEYLYIFIAILVMQILLLMAVVKIWPLPRKYNTHGFMLPIIHTPQLKLVMQKALASSWWYLRDISRLIFMGSLALFVLESLGVLNILRNLLAYPITHLLELPLSLVSILILGLLRKDLGAIALYDFGQ